MQGRLYAAAYSTIRSTWPQREGQPVALSIPDTHSGVGGTVNGLDAHAVRIDSTSATPPFEQVRAHIAGLIARGELSPGTKLPTVRQLATDVSIAANTAARVYRELESDGLIATHGRRGTFVSSEITEIDSVSEVAAQARAAARGFTGQVRRLGLSRAEAVQLVEQHWTEA